MANRTKYKLSLFNVLGSLLLIGGAIFGVMNWAIIINPTPDDWDGLCHLVLIVVGSWATMLIVADLILQRFIDRRKTVLIIEIIILLVLILQAAYFSS